MTTVRNDNTRMLNETLSLQVYKISLYIGLKGVDRIQYVVLWEVKGCGFSNCKLPKSTCIEIQHV